MNVECRNEMKNRKKEKKRRKNPFLFTIIRVVVVINVGLDI